MGMWGIGPSENDQASNWLDELYSAGLETHILATLNRPLSEHWEEVRVAATMASSLIEANLWPSDRREIVRSLAADRLEQIISEKVVTNSVLIADIRSQIQQMRFGVWRQR